MPGWAGTAFETARRYHLILVVPLLAAWLGGPLITAWLRRLGARRGAAIGEAVARAASGSVRLLILLIVLGWVIALLPLVPSVEAPLGGALYVASVLVAARLAMRVLGVLVHAYLERAAGPARERAQRDFLPLGTTLTTIVVAVLAVIQISHHFGHDVSSLVAALGIGSLAIGLAAQQTLGNMFAGFTLLVDRPFRPGDRVRLQSGETGRVQEIGIRSTKIVLDDQNLLIVPNAELANSRVVNFALPSPGSRGEVRVRLPWATSARLVDEAIALLTELARAQPEVSPEPAPEAVVAGFVETNAEVVLRFHVLDQAVQPLVEERIRRGLVDRLAERAAGHVAPAPPVR